MDTNINERLRKARKYLNLSQEFVANQLGIPRTAITAIELGQRSISSRELEKFSELYGLTLDEIMYGNDEIMTVQAFARQFSELSENDRIEIQNLIEFKKSLKKRNESL
jgi:transcriptional regulator with XRE-family HTH domain